MQKSSIEWCTHSWNPVTGCEHGCSYCYAAELARTRLARVYGVDGRDPFIPRFWGSKLNEPAGLKEPSHIFTVSMGDLFSPGVDDAWILRVLFQIMLCPEHTFTVLTKNPIRALRTLVDFAIPPERLFNLMLGTSVTGEMDDAEKMRVRHLLAIPSPIRRVLSAEPLTRPLTLSGPTTEKLDWLIIGGRTGKLPFKPPTEWVEALVSRAREYETPVFCKDNLGIEGAPWEWPEGVPH
jgi:protein gp37